MVKKSEPIPENTRRTPAHNLGSVGEVAKAGTLPKQDAKGAACSPLVSKATVPERLKALLQAAEKAPSKSILAILQAGRRIEVQITERGPGTDFECYQFYPDQDDPNA